MHNLSDEVLCARWIENPYYQYFCGELSFCHRLPFDRSSMTRWRQRLGEEQLVALIQESLSVAHKTGAIGPKDLERVAVDTTVQPKADCASDRRAADASGASRSSSGSPSATACRCARAICAWPSAPPSWSAAIPTPISSSAPGASSSSCGRDLAGSSATSAARSMAMRRWKLASARCSIWRSGCAHQDQHQRGPKVYALHAPEVECIGKGKARAPYEFGCKVSYRHPRDRARRAASSCSMPRRCTAIPSTGTRSAPWSPTWRSSPASRLAASMSTRATAATTTRTGSGSGSRARSAASRLPSGAR